MGYGGWEGGWMSGECGGDGVWGMRGGGGEMGCWVWREGVGREWVGDEGRGWGRWNGGG